jgi:hypothetical protein
MNKDMMEHKFKYIFLLLKILFFVLIVFNFNFSLAQDIYRTQNGNVLITYLSSDTLIILTSKEVIITLNNETAKFKMTIDKSTLRCDDVKINEKLSFMKFDEINFSGKFDLENIDKYNHAPLEFDVYAENLTNNKALLGKGRLEHISPEGHIRCLLTLKFIIDKDDLGLNLSGLNLQQDVQVDVVQVLLNID